MIKLTVSDCTLVTQALNIPLNYPTINKTHQQVYEKKRLSHKFNDKLLDNWQNYKRLVTIKEIWID